MTDVCEAVDMVDQLFEAAGSGTTPDSAEAVETPSEIARLAAEAGPEERYVDAEDETVREGWRIDSVSSLDWALMRISELEAEQARNKAITEDHIARLTLRLEKLNATADRGVKFFRSHVTAYVTAHRHELLGSGKKKSTTLPHGSVGWKKVPAKAVVTDKAALLAWAQRQPVEEGVLRITEEPAWSEIKKRIEQSGAVVPGTDYEPEGEALQIKTQETT